MSRKALKWRSEELSWAVLIISWSWTFVTMIAAINLTSFQRLRITESEWGNVPTKFVNIFVEDVDRIAENRPRQSFGARWHRQWTFVTPEFLQIVLNQWAEIEMNGGSLINLRQSGASSKKCSPGIAHGIIGIVFITNTLDEKAQNSQWFGDRLLMNNVQISGVFFTITRTQSHLDRQNKNREIVLHAMLTARCVILSPMEMEVDEFVRSFQTAASNRKKRLLGIDESGRDAASVVR